MDKLLPDALQDYVSASRFRSERRRIRAAKSDADKHLIALKRKREELGCELRKKVYVPLTPPVMKGYKRFFVLRDDVARGVQASFFQGILDKINTYDYFHRRDYKVKKRKHGKKILVVKEQQVLSPDRSHFKKMNFTAAEAAFFEERDVPHRCGRGAIRCMVFTQPWRFVLRVRPNMITERRIIDPVLLAEEQQLDNHIKNHQLAHRMYWLFKGKSNRRWNWCLGEKVKYRMQPKTLQQWLQEVINNTEEP
ncbi:hypothetical protein [Chitinophaga solisilvae]|uniref:hypothetical protein n=1 Tax=Chitinophaga solisilvae TaxID=1233460 RepID=UPI00136A7C61|nr:hypothetical protein [Chitinophaga solisilvae]